MGFHSKTILAEKRANDVRLSLATNELADFLRIRPQSIRAALCRDGHYMGLRPSKLPNGRLLWNAAEAARLVDGEV